MADEVVHYSIGLGYCGPTDCCLILERETKYRESVEYREYGIESPGWRILSFVRGKISPDNRIGPTWDVWEILDMLWEHGDPEDYNWN